MRRHLITVGLCLTLAACGASTADHHGQQYTQASTSRATSSSGYAKARAAWKQSATAAAADVDRYLVMAARDLQAAGGSGSAAAVRALKALAAIPETGTTHAQQAEARADVAALDSYFRTPGLTPNG